MRPANKGFFAKLGVGAIALTMLAACGPVKATPTASDYNAPLLSFSDGSTVENNTLKRIYDALVTAGDTNSEAVLENVLYLYSQSVYGSFFDAVDDAGNVTAPGLKTVVEDYLGNAATDPIDAFARLYPVYAAEAGDAEAVAHARINVVNFYEEVVYRINTAFAGYVTNSSYQERSLFQEKLFYDAQVKGYYKLPATCPMGPRTLISPPTSKSKAPSASWATKRTTGQP